MSLVTVPTSLLPILPHSDLTWLPPETPDVLLQPLPVKLWFLSYVGSTGVGLIQFSHSWSLTSQAQCNELLQHLFLSDIKVLEVSMTPSDPVNFLGVQWVLSLVQLLDLELRVIPDMLMYFVIQPALSSASVYFLAESPDCPHLSPSIAHCPGLK